MYAYPFEMHFDFCMRSLIQSLCDYDRPQAMKVVGNKVLDYLLKQNPSPYQTLVLAGAF